MNIFIIMIPIVLILPALYWLLGRRSRGSSEAMRPDRGERSELTGGEQARRRRPK